MKTGLLIKLAGGMCLGLAVVMAAVIIWLPENDAAQGLDPTADAIACDPEIVWYPTEDDDPAFGFVLKD